MRPLFPLPQRSLPVALLAVLAAALAPAGARAVSTDTVLLPDLPAAKSAAPTASRLADRLAGAPLAALEPARSGAHDALQGIAAWNASGGSPTRNGFARRLAVPVPVALGDAERAVATTKDARATAAGTAQRAPSGALTWASEVRVRDAQRLRLHLTNVHLPPTARLWVYGT